jgi:DNA-binding SARP family transcriptional activator
VSHDKPVRDSAWKSKRARTFLKLLVASDGHTVSRDTAFELLWPDADPDSLGQSFNSMLHRVRKVLEPGACRDEAGSCILQEDGVITLSKDRVWIDAAQFHVHVSSANRLKTKQLHDQTLAEYEKAFELYQGDFLPEDRYVDWASSTRDRLRLQHLKALEDAAATAEACGDRDRTLRFYEKIFSADPCSEKACCWLMMRYQSDARRGDAIRAYERCERALSTELDMEPAQETKKLYRSIIGR